MRRLELGITIENTDVFLTYEELSNIYGNENRLLKEQVIDMRTVPSTNLGSSYSGMYYDLHKRHKEMENKYKMKNKVDNMLLWLHNNLESNIVIEEEWKLNIKGYNVSIGIDLYKKLYKLNHNEREMLENRINTDIVWYKLFFMNIKNEPTIHSEIEAHMKKPKDAYYFIHGYQKPIEPYDKIISI